MKHLAALYSTVPRITVRIDEETESWLEEEAERLNWSKAVAGGVCIELIHDERDHISFQQTDSDSDSSSMQVDADRLDELEERLADAEARIDALESQRVAHDHQPDTPAAEDDESPTPTEDSLSAATGGSQHTPDAGGVESVDEQPGEKGPSSVEAALEGWEPGQGEESRERRRQVGAVVLGALRDNGRMSASDFKDQLHPEHAVGEESADSWWRRTAREAIRHARKRGAVRYHDGPAEYEWVGDA